MLPFLLGSLSNWLTSKKQAPRAERREKELKARKQVKNLVMETLEDRITPANTAYLYNTLNVLQGTFTGVSAIQDAVNAVTASNWRIDVETGNYENVSITGATRSGLTIQAISGQTPVIDAAFGPTIVVQIDTSGIIMRGMTIQDSGTPDAVVGVNFTSNSDNTILENNIIQNFTRGAATFDRAININAGADGLEIRNNTITGNYWGIRFNSFATINNLQIHNNFITNNTDTGIYVEPGFNGSNDKIFDNSITGNGASAHNGSTTTLDLSRNWWGSNVAATIQSSFTGSGTFDFSPFINFGTDTSASVGFQPDLSYLNVTVLGSQVGSTGRIQEGIDGIQNGTLNGAARTLKVLAGTYTLTAANIVNKQLTLLGQQSGVDARTRGVVSETIVDASGLTGYPSTNFDIQSGINSVTIDGFTLQGAQGGQGVGSIYMEDGTSGTIVRNNIIQNNHVGIFLDNDSAVLQTVIEKNLFRNNTASGPASGHGIYADNSTVGGDLQNVLIQNNNFTNTAFVEDTWAIGLGNYSATPFSNITVTGNQITNHGRGLYAYGTSGLSVTNNTITGTIAAANHYGIGLFGYSASVPNATSTISSNILSNNGIGGVYVSSDVGGPAYSGSLTLSGNTYTTGVGDHSIYNDSATAIDATADIFNGQLASSATLAQQFVIVDTIVDGVDRAGAGLVRTKAGHVYVTPNSFNNDAGFTTPSTTPKIQRGINVATSGDIIDVQAGTYIENLLVNKSVTLLGPNSAISASTLAPRNPEAVIQASGPIGHVVDLSANNVTVRGFTVTGYDPLAGSYATLSSNALTNAGEAFRNTGLINNLSIQNNIVQNAGIGVRLDGSSASTGNVIDNNWFHDIGAYDYGYAVSLRSNFYADVTNNRMTQVHSGLHTLNFSQAGTGTWLFQGNTVQAYAAGLWDNLQYSSADSLIVNNNNISVLSAVPTVPNYADFNGKSIGMLFVSLQNSVSATVTNNIVNGMAYGAVFYNTDSSNPIVLNSTNTISNSTVAGVFLTNIVGFNPIGSTVLGGGANNPTGVSKVVLDNINLTNNVTGIIDQGNNAFTAFGTSLTFQNGTTVTGGTLGLSIIGDKAGVTGNTLANTTFTGQSGNYITLSSSALGSPFTYLNGTGVTYGTVLGSGASLAQGFTIEDKITHGTDTAGLGYVRITPNLVYVTQNSGSIQRGVNVASANDTLYISAGTFAEAVTVDKPLTIRGAKYGVNAITRFAAFVTGVDGPKANPAVETILTAAATAPNSAANDTLHIMADNITVDGLVVDGNNPALAQGGATVIGGINTDSRRGIQTEDAAGNFFAVNNLTLQNNIVQNFSQRGIQLINPTGSSPATSGNLITGNVVRNIGQDAIRLQWNAYSDVTNNTIDMPVNGEAGIWMQDFSINGGPPKTVDISGNTVTVSQDAFGGIWANLIYAPNVTINIHDNTVNAALGVTGASDYTFGIYLSSIQGGTTATLTNNTVGSSGGQFARGISLWNLPTTITTTVTGGSVGNSLIGVSVHYNDPNFGGAGASTVVNLSNIAVSAVNEGVLVEGVGTPNTTRAQLSGLTINGSATGIHVDGATASLVGNTLSNTIFTGITGNYVSLTNTSGNGPVEIDGTGASYNGVSGGITLSLANGFAIEDKINDYLDINTVGSANVGFVRLRAGHVYVTQLSNSIQRGINAANINDTIYVNSGTYLEAIQFTGKTGLTLYGAPGFSSIIKGPKNDGLPYTVWMNSSNNTIDGFKITRDGNNATDWGTNDTNSGVIFDSAGTGNILRNSFLTENRNGILIANAFGNTITRNIIDFNRTGINVQGAVNNNSFTENFITNNWTFGIIFINASGDSTGNTFSNNSIAGNWYSQVDDQNDLSLGSALRNLSGNWFGTSTVTRTNVNTSSPGYSSQIPSVFPGGSATAPGGAVVIGGISSSNIDYTPYLMSGVDTDLGTPGFQGDFSNLTVTSDAAQTQALNRIQEGYNLVTAGGLVHILGGTYGGGNVTTGVKAATFSPGASPAMVTVNGNFTLSNVTTLAMEMNGAAPGTGYDQFVINGDVTLNNAILSVTRTFAYPTGSDVVLIVNNSVNPTNGTFASMAEGSTVTVMGLPFTITYQYPAPTGNDVALQLVPVSTVWVDDNWTLVFDADASSSITPGDTVTSGGGTVTNKIFGYNAYATIQNGITGVAAPGNVIVLTGTYDEAVLVNKQVVLDGQADAGPLPIVTRTAGSNQNLFIVNADNVTIRDFTMLVNRPFATAGVSAQEPDSFNNLQILNNTITSQGSGGSFINGFIGTSSVGIALLANGGPLRTVTISGNTIDGTGPSSFFTRGIWQRAVNATVGGATLADGNSVIGLAQDLLMQFASGVTNTIRNNTFLAAGVDITENESPTINIHQNTFSPGAAFPQALLLKHGYYPTNTVNVFDNVFNVQTIGVLSGNSRNSNIYNNTFNAVANDATMILADTRYPTGSLAGQLPTIPYPGTNQILVQGNDFNGAGFTGVTGISFYNRNAGLSSFSNADITLGGAGALANTFRSNLAKFIYLDPTTAASPPTAPFGVNIDATQNKFGVTGFPAGILPTAMTLSQLFEVEDKIVHKIDVSTLGLVTIKANELFVTTNSFLAPYTTAGSIQRGVDAASAGNIIHVTSGTFVENVIVDEEVTIWGAGQGSTIVVPAFSAPNPGPGSLPPGHSSIFLIRSNNVTIQNLTADGDNPLLASPEAPVNGADIDARNGIITDHATIITPITGLTVQNVTVQNVWLRGIYASTAGGTFNILNNIVQNVAADPASIGIFNWAGSGLISGNQVTLTNDAISANHSAGTTFSFNTISNSMSGIHTDNAGDGGGTSDLIHDNIVQNGGPTFGSYGIWAFVPYLNVQIYDNIVNDVDVGLAAFAGANGASINFTNNQVDINNRPNSLGAWVSTTTFYWGSGNVNAVFTSNTIKNASTLLQVDQENAINGFLVSVSPLTIHPNVDDGQLAGGGGSLGGNIAEGGKGGGEGLAGIAELDSTVSEEGGNAPKGRDLSGQTPLIAPPPVIATVILTGNTFDNTATSLSNTIGVDINGGTITFNAGNQILGSETGLRMSAAISDVSLVGNTLNNLVLNSQTGKQIVLTSSALDNVEIDGTNVTYNGVVGNTVSNAQGYTIEDGIQDAIDAGTLGFIRIRSGHVYVTPLSFAATEGTTTPDLQRAVDAAGLFGDVVHIKGNTSGTPYVGNVSTAGKSVTLDPGASPAQVFLNGDLTLDSNDTFVVEFTADTTPGVTFDQWVINGTVDLGSATLNLGSSSLVAVGDQIKLIDNDSGDPVTGIFAGYTNGSVITVGGQYFIIFYNGGTGNDVTLTRYNLAAVGDTYAEDTGWLALPNGTFILDAYPTIPGNQSAVKGFDAFDTIQQAINAVIVAGTVYVNAGTYVEDITIPKSLTLHGTNAGINPNTGSRIAEAIIRPASSNPDPFAATTAVVNITASNVTVDGFIVDGDNTTITSGVLVNGVDVDATDGIFSETGVGNITVQNNVVRNTSYTGLNFDNLDNLGGVTSNNLLRDNKLTNIGHIPYGYGIGILVYDNFYAQITGNVMTDVRVGVQTGNFYLANTGPAAQIDNNDISSTRIGIYHNLAYSAASPFAITNNTVNVVNEAGNTRWFGIAVLSIQGTVGVTVSNNTINAVGVTSQLKSGYFLWNNPTTSTVTVSGGTVTGADYGINVSNRHPGFGDGASFSAVISGVSVTNSSIAGILVNDNPANANNATVAVTVTGNTTVSGSPTGILVTGSDASANINNNLSSIYGNVIGIDVNAGSATITSNSIYDNGTGIRFTNGGSGSVTSNNFLGPITNFLANTTDLRIDATAGAVAIGSNNLFGGGSSNPAQFANPIGYYIDNRSSQAYNLVGSGSTFNRSNGTAWSALSTGVLSDNFRIEDRLYQAPDSATSGLIRVVTGNVYVSQPGTGANDESIQFAINAASVNDTVNLERGTHTLTATVNVNKPVTLQGEGTTGITATTVTNPTVNQDTFDFAGINAPAGTVNFQNFRVAGSGAVGIDYSVAQGPLGTISLSGMLIENNKWNGLGIFGTNATPLTGMNVNVTNTTFNDNGEQATLASSLGNGDLIFFLYNGNANLTNVTVDGYASNGANNGIQFRGSDIPQAAGTLTFNNVSVLGSYLRPTYAGGGLGSGILIQNYTTVGALSFTSTSINLVNGLGFNTAGVTGTIDLASTSINVGTGFYIATGTSSQNNVPTNVTATNTTLGGVAMLGATNAQYFTAEDRIGDRIDVPSTLPFQIGMVRLKAGNVFVTPNSFIAPFTTFADIQRGIDASSNGETVWVAAGTFNNDLLINKSINLFGAGIDTTYVYGVGPTGSPYASADRGGATMQVQTTGVVVDGFTISRLGNNPTDWNDAGLNTAGLAVQGQTASAEVRYSKFVGNRTAIDINNSNGNYIHNNIIDNNRTGLLFRNQTDNTTVSQNFITNNWTVGVLFIDGSGGTNSPIQSAANSSFFNNNISGNWYGQIVDRQTGGALPAPGTNIKNFSGNWLGTTSPVVTVANSAEPSYAALIPMAFGGSAVPPGGQPDIAGAASANIDFSPYLGTGADLDSNPNNGFQGDFSNLWVTTAGAQSGPLGRITEALGLATSGGTITILGGSYVDNVNTTAQPIFLNIGTSTGTAQVTITGSLTMGSTTTVNFNMNGPNTTTPVGGTDYDQIVTTGATNLGGATFNITKAPAYFPVLGANFALIRSTVSKTGSFNYGGLVAENAIIAIGGINFKVNYNLGSGPFDLNLGVVIPNNIVYVWSGWSGQFLGDFYQAVPPTSTLAAPPGGYATFTGDPVTYGYNAYSTIQDAINAVSSGATIRIYIGTYTQDITVSTGKNNLQLVAFGAAGTRTINGVAGGPSATITLQGTGTIFSGNSASDNFVVNQTAADNLAGIRTAAGSLGTTVSYVNVSGTNNATNFTGVDVGAGTWINYSNGSITNYRSGIKVNSNAGSISNPIDIQSSTINGAGWASLTIAPVGVDVGLNGYAKLTNSNVISGNRWGVRVLGGTAMLQGNNLSGNNHMGASAAGLFVANGGVVDAGQVIDGSELNYTGLGISSGNNLFTTGYAMGSAQAIVNLNANFGVPPSGTGNLTDGTNVSARNNSFGTTIYGNVERIVNHAIDNSFQGYVDYRNATGAALPTQEGATQYYAISPVTSTLANQRSIIRGLQFVIDSPVTMQSGAIALNRTDSSDPMFDMDNQAFYLSVYGSLLPVGSVPLNVTSSVSGTTGRTTVNVTFQASSFTTSGSLVDGFYGRTVNASLVDLLFAGSGTNFDNAPVTTAQSDFHRLFGDINGDQFVSVFDNSRFQNAYRVADSLYAQYFDYNNSGSTFFDATDFNQFNLRFGGFIL